MNNMNQNGRRMRVQSRRERRCRFTNEISAPETQNSADNNPSNSGMGRGFQRRNGEFRKGQGSGQGMNNQGNNRRRRIGMNNPTATHQ